MKQNHRWDKGLVFQLEEKLRKKFEMIFQVQVNMMQIILLWKIKLLRIRWDQHKEMILFQKKLRIYQDQECIRVQTLLVKMFLVFQWEVKKKSKLEQKHQDLEITILHYLKIRIE